jgi:hypothetical protein
MHDSNQDQATWEECYAENRGNVLCSFHHCSICSFNLGRCPWVWRRRCPHGRIWWRSYGWIWRRPHGRFRGSTFWSCPFWRRSLRRSRKNWLRWPWKNGIRRAWQECLDRARCLGRQRRLGRQMGRRQMGWRMARWTLVALVGCRRWRRTGRRVAVLRRLRLRLLCPVDTGLRMGEHLRLSVRRLLLLASIWLSLLVKKGAAMSAPNINQSR